MYKYRILDSKGKDLLNGPVRYENIFVSQYPVEDPGNKLVSELLPGESTKVKYLMTGVDPSQAEICTILCVEVIERRYRVTRPLAYYIGSEGFNDPRARQGYYVMAENEEQARLRLRRQMCMSEEEPLDVEEWV